MLKLEAKVNGEWIEQAQCSVKEYTELNASDLEPQELQTIQNLQPNEHYHLNLGAGGTWRITKLEASLVIILGGIYHDVFIGATAYKGVAYPIYKAFKSHCHALAKDKKAEDSLFQGGVSFRIHLDRLSFADAQNLADAIYELADSPEAKSTAYLTTIQAWYGAQNWEEN